MRAQAQAIAEQVVSPSLVVPDAEPKPAQTPELVQASRRNAPVHIRDPEVPSHSLRGWRYSQPPARRLVADPLSEEAGGPAPLCVR
eukprot:2858167-Alexandrium_andersonii.AAC.1